MPSIKLRDKLQLIITLYNSGKNTYEIAEILSVSQSSIWKRLKQLGIKRRTISEVKKGISSWNKGLHFSDEAKKNMSISKRGKHSSLSTEFKKDHIPSNFKNDVTSNKIISLYKKGLSIKEVSLRLGFKDISMRVSKVIREFGISRPVGKKNNGGFVTQHGYRMVSYHCRKVLEHHLIWIQHNQMPIPRGYIIHHRNMNKTDNRIENLMLLPSGVHAWAHNLLRQGKVVYA